MIERIKTGIPGMDDLIEGGIKQGSITLLAGPTGTLKTIISSQFIYNGAKEYGEGGIYLTLEEKEDGIRQSLANFGMDVDAPEVKDKIQIVDLSGLRKRKPQFGESKERYAISVDVLMETITSITQKSDVKRLVIDSISILGLLYKDQSDMRDDLFIFTEFLRESGLTSLLVTEIEEEYRGKRVSRFGLEEFLADGVVVLGYTQSKGELRRWATVRKMRFTDHNLHMHPVRITPCGVEIVSTEKIY